MTTEAPDPRTVQAEEGELEGTGESVTAVEGRPWWRRLWVHVAALSVVLLGILLWLDNGSVGFPDEGLYAAQADNLADGSWARDLPRPDIDPEGRWISATGSSITEDGQYIPYTRHVLYPLLLTPFVRWGTGAMMLTSLLSVVAAAACSALLARRLHESLDIPTLWLVGVGSPLLFSAYFIGGHAPAAALAAFLALLSCWVVDDGDSRWIAPSLVVAALLTGVRTEGVIAALAIGGVLGLQAIRWRRPRESDLRTMAFAIAIGAVSVSAFYVDGWLARALSDGVAASALDGERGSDFLEAGYVMLIRPYSSHLAYGAASLLIVLPAVVLAVALYRLLPRLRLLSIGILWMAAVAAVMAIPAEANLVSGLLAAFPVLVFGLLMLDRAGLRQRLTVRLLGSSLLATVVILSTTYGEGGATEWGGRFLHLLVPLAAPAALLGLHRVFVELDRPSALLLSGALVVLTLATSVNAIIVNKAFHDAALATIENANETTQSWSSQPQPVIAISGFEASGSARIFWEQLPDEPVLAVGNVGGLRNAIREVQSAGHDELFVVFSGDAGFIDYLIGETLEEVGWSILDSRKAEHGSTYLHHLGDNAE